jgi:hypothetical protein
LPTLISETDVKLERSDLTRRIVLPREVGPDGFIVQPRRTPGLHLSGVLKYIAHRTRIAARLAEIEEEEMPLRFAIGQAWEEYAASLFPDMVWAPGECNDPVIMTCDGISIEAGNVLDPDDNSGSYTLIHEYKFNRSRKYSGKDLLKKKWLWIQQCLGYCIGYGASVARWNALWAMEFPDPVWTQYTVAFSPKELIEARNMIEMNRQGAIDAGYAE